jgi:hypothetical protein
MEQRVLALTPRDRDRLTQLRGVLNGDLRVGQAARRLKLSSRQVRRLLQRVKQAGDRGVIHGLRGRASNRRIGADVRARAVKLLSRPVYRGFGPTLAAEHLARVGIEISRETMRHWMSDAGLWRARKQRIERIHVWRERRAAFGELVLMDSSEHDWLEGRGPRLSLIAMMDDATDRMLARFVEHDTSQENLRTLRCWLQRYGRPLALYTDRHSIFVTIRSKHEERWGRPIPATSFGQALEELRIEWIAAYSPQAKGRIERLFETLQDRLIKELRIADIRSAEQANRFLEEIFMAQYHERFTHLPRESKDAHRSIKGFDLDSMLSLRDTRLVTADYTLSLDGRRFAVPRGRIVPGLRRAFVVVETRLDGSRWLRHRTHRLPLIPLPAVAPASPSGLRPPGLAGKKSRLGQTWRRPTEDHPWRRSIHAEAVAQLAKRTLLSGRQADTSTLR